ncbi:MAG: hypothetical protein V1824_00685 [archaeon]
MIGKSEWFKRRKYLGWGLVPKTKEGWIYVFLLIIPLIVFQALPFWSEKTRLIVTGVWITLILIDVFTIMLKLKKDERETMHEAISDRNACWFMIFALAIGVFYQTITSASSNNFYIDPIIMIALLGGAIVKTISNIYLEHKN